METEKLYSPLYFYLHDKEAAEEGRYDERDYWRDPIDHEEAHMYMDAIELAIRRDRDTMDKELGMAEYVPDSLRGVVVSLFPNIELHGDKLWCVADVALSRPITPGEIAELTEWWSGQLSDGWGEGFEQREIAVDRGELYIEPWSSDDSFFIMTQKEFDRRMEPHVAGIHGTVESTAMCVNGELKPGDLVISSPNDDYGCLVGTVLYIEKLGTPEHDTENETDDVHVNFRDTEYSENRLQEIEQQIGELYGMPTTPSIWPAVGIDDVIMSPDMLFRITGISRDELTSILDSRDNAAAYYQKNTPAPLPETPAQAALHEPDMYDDEATAALRRQLTERLDANLTAYFEDLYGDAGRNVTGMSAEIAAVAGAHCYLTGVHNFHTSELEYLLRFQNPLRVVADAFESSGMDNRSDIMWDIFDRQTANLSGYPLVEAVPDEAALKQALFKRLDENFADMMNDLRSDIADSMLSNAEAAAIAERITAVNNAYSYLSKASLPGEQVAYLLNFQYPLEVMANRWPTTPDGLVDMSSVVADILKDKSAHGRYAAAAEADPPTRKGSVRSGTEKPSVLEQIRQARAAMKEPGNNRPPQDKSEPER